MQTSKKQLPTCQPKTAVAYARYSSAQQRDVSIEQQLRDIRAYAEREGYTIIYEYADHAKSGFKNVERRTQFQAMIQAAASGAFDTVIAWKVDRFGRNRRESAIFKSQLAEHGVSVIYAMEPIPDGAAGVLTEGMLEALAEWYSRNLSENSRRGQRDNALKCLSNGKYALGYKRGPDGHYAIDESTAPIVRRIYTMYSEGYSACAIARQLNSEGLKTQNGIDFHADSIIKILKNETFIGIYHHGDVRIPGGLPAIVDEELWNTCQKIRQASFKKRSSKRTYLLSGKLICGNCGEYMVGNSSPKYKSVDEYIYYGCKKRINFKGGCGAKSIRAKKIDRAVLGFLFDNVLAGNVRETFVDLVVKALADQDVCSPVKSLEAELEEITRKIKNINSAIAEGIWTSDTKAMLTDLSARSEDLKAKIAYLQLTESKAISEDRIRFLFEKIAEGKRDDPEYLKTVVSTLINSVTVYPDCLRIVINAAKHTDTVPPEDLPPIDVLPDISSLGLQSPGLGQLFTIPNYPVIIFKIAI
jgi:DNA invertase Pin-like site-specific DNA recombinase